MKIELISREDVIFNVPYGIMHAKKKNERQLVEQKTAKRDYDHENYG